MKHHNFDTVKLHEKLMREAAAPEFEYRGQDLQQWEKELKERLSDLLGMDAMPEKCDLNPQTIWTKKHEYGTIEKIVFTAEPGYSVPAYVCLPKNTQPPYDFFICLQGHSTGMHNSIAVAKTNEDETIEIAGDRDFGIGCMKRGIAALCIEQRGFGECEDGRRKNFLACHNPTMQALMLGRTILGERIYDVDRAIDYLLTRTDAKADRIGVMGNSGGGTVSIFAGGLLDRLSFVMPACSFSSFLDSIMSIDHCCCNYVSGLLALADCAEITALAAPKPLVVVNGLTDPIFPIDSAKQSFTKVKEIYERFGAGENCLHVIGGEGHQFYADEAWEAMFRLIRHKN